MPAWIVAVDRIAVHIAVEVEAVVHRVAAQELAECRVVIARPQAVETRRRIKLLAGVEVLRAGRAAYILQAAIGIVNVALADAAVRAGYRAGAALLIVQQVVRAGACGLRQHLAARQRVARPQRARAVRFEQHIAIGRTFVPYIVC